MIIILGHCVLIFIRTKLEVMFISFYKINLTFFLSNTFKLTLNKKDIDKQLEENMY